MNEHSRRDFVRLAAVTAALGAVPAGGERALAATASSAASRVPFDLGIASYTFRSFPLDQAIAMTARLRVRKITLKDMHLPMAVTAQEMAVVREKMKAAGVELSSCGVVYMKTEEEVRKAFAYAKQAGITMMVGVPDAPLMGLAEQQVKDTGIAMAIHNHGPNDQRFPSPQDAYRAVEKRDRRMGLCIDVGHTQRLGLDPSVEIERYFDRLLDVHIKDVSSADAKGTTVEIGSGVIDIPKLLKTLVRLGYSKTIHFEHEKDAKDPFPGVAESVGYVRGVLAAL
ncbi:MAG TPA: sugar phosphate isomerase/epimerase [Vicinamibacterales bacterium]|jgi:sugar phosphate isomerase/epimerase